MGCFAIEMSSPTQHWLCMSDFVYLSLIDDFRGACAVKGYGAVAGHVKRIDPVTFSTHCCFARKR